MANLTAANQARLEKSLAQLFRFDGVVMTLKQKLDRDAVKFEAVDAPKYQYNRLKFNRMNHAEQAEYERKLEERKTSYRAFNADGSFIEIPKIVFEHYSQKNANCNVLFCILGKHDGNTHTDATGSTWEEETPENEVIAHAI